MSKAEEKQHAADEERGGPAERPPVDGQIGNHGPNADTNDDPQRSIFPCDEYNVEVSDDSNSLKINDDVMLPEPKSMASKVLRNIKYTMSMILIFFCLTVVIAAIFSKQTIATGERSVPPAIAFVIFWALLLWLALMEGGLNVMVALKPVAKALYSQSHPLALRSTTLVHRGDNLERFIVGRQYLDLTMVFTTSFMVSTIKNASVLNLPTIVNNIFLESGLAIILVTIVFGQLVAQINCTRCMLDFINNRLMVVTSYIALTVEASGILHAVYLVQWIFTKVSGKHYESEEEPRTKRQSILFWGRVLVSVSVLLVALAMSLAALFQGNTTMWAGVPPVASLILLVALILIGGLMEGLQIALMAVVHLPESALAAAPAAKSNCQLIFRGHANNLQAFLIGRQILQTVIMFTISKIISIRMKTDDNLFGVPDGLQNILNVGVLGAFISTIIASLSWRVLASNFPITFLANPLSTWVIRFCLLTEASGVCYAAWIFADWHAKIMGYRRDVDFLGNLEELTTQQQQAVATKNKEDTADLELAISMTEGGAAAPASEGDRSATERDMSSSNSSAEPPL